jgi:Fe-S cluster assembly ATP-binding protein
MRKTRLDILTKEEDMSQLLTINDLTVNVKDKTILHGINLEVDRGETHVLMGPNGAGKSTLGNAIMGNPNYEITKGSVFFNGEDILEDDAAERAKKGIFLSFQNPIEVPGISLADFIRNSLDCKNGTRTKIWEFRKELDEKLKLLNMDGSYADRDLNLGFSGGEKKKAEILQLLMLNPTLAILDETDSGLDVDAVRTVSAGVKEFQKDPNRALIIITHSTRILEKLHVDYTHIMVEGRMAETGDASLVDKVNREGFIKYAS